LLGGGSLCGGGLLGSGRCRAALTCRRGRRGPATLGDNHRKDCEQRNKPEFPTHLYTIPSVVKNLNYEFRLVSNRCFSCLNAPFLCEGKKQKVKGKIVKDDKVTR
jgi:hypothetical protein